MRVPRGGGNGAALKSCLSYQVGRGAGVPKLTGALAALMLEPLTISAVRPRTAVRTANGTSPNQTKAGHRVGCVESRMLFARLKRILQTGSPAIMRAVRRPGRIPPRCHRTKSSEARWRPAGRPLARRLPGRVHDDPRSRRQRRCRNALGAELVCSRPDFPQLLERVESSLTEGSGLRARRGA